MPIAMQRGHAVVRRARIGALLVCSLALFACGGGGGDGTPVPAPTDAGVEGNAADRAAEASGIVLAAPEAVQGTDRIRLSWQVQGKATTYTVFVRRSDSEDFEAVPATIDGHTAEFGRGAAWRLDFPTAQVRVQGCNPGKRCIDSNAQPLLDALLAGIAQVEPSSVAINSVFGNVVASSADGNTVVAAAPTDRVVGDPNAPGFGSVFVFHRGSDGRWSEQARLNRFHISNNFGGPLALSGDGNTLVVGVPSEAGAAGGIDPPVTGSNVFDPFGLPEARGAVYVFTRSAQQWSQQAFIKAAAPVLQEQFGQRIVLSHDGNRMGVAGRESLYLFERNASTWRQERRLTGGAETQRVAASEGLAMSADGRSVALKFSGEVVQGDLRTPYYAVHVYTKCPCGDGWKRVADLRSTKPLDSRGELDDRFGSSLSFSADGKTLAVGAPADPGDASDTGTATNRNAFDAGAIYVYGPDANGTWQRRAFLKARGAPARDAMGSQVALNADGSVLATKACGYAANAGGLRRNHRAGDAIGQLPGDTFCFWGGSAYVFELGVDGRWAHTAAAIAAPGELVSYDFFALAFSADAQTLALGVMSYSAVPGHGRLVVY